MIFPEQWIIGIHVIPVETELEVLAPHWVFIPLYIACTGHETEIMV